MVGTVPFMAFTIAWAMVSMLWLGALVLISLGSRGLFSIGIVSVRCCSRVGCFITGAWVTWIFVGGSLCMGSLDCFRLHPRDAFVGGLYVFGSCASSDVILADWEVLSFMRLCCLASILSKIFALRCANFVSLFSDELGFVMFGVLTPGVVTGRFRGFKVEVTGTM